MFQETSNVFEGCRSKPISSQLGMKKAVEHDEEGRLIMLEFDTFLLINVYVRQQP